MVRPGSAVISSAPVTNSTSSSHQMRRALRAALRQWFGGEPEAGETQRQQQCRGEVSARARMCTDWMAGMAQVLAWMAWLGPVWASQSPN